MQNPLDLKAGPQHLKLWIVYGIIGHTDAMHVHIHLHISWLLLGGGCFMDSRTRGVSCVRVGVS